MSWMAHTGWKEEMSKKTGQAVRWQARLESWVSHIPNVHPELWILAPTPPLILLGPQTVRAARPSQQLYS